MRKYGFLCMTDIEILLATYNSEEYIDELLGSILSQTYGDFTVIIRDDGSTDRTREILSGYDDSRIRIVPDTTPTGSAAANFYTLLGLSDADYIMFADADDFWLPDKVEKTLALMKENESRYGKDSPLLVHADAYITDAALNITGESLFRYEKIDPSRDALNQLLGQNIVTGCTMMINRALHGLVPERPQSSVMHDWWLALAACCFGHIVLVKQPLMYYRQHGDNQVGAYNAGSIVQSARRFSDRERYKVIYKSMFEQAACFADTFEGRLSPEQLRLCREYASLADKNRLQKISTIFRNRFFKNTFARNVGQMLII